MYCTNCAKEIPDGSVFCLQCGREVARNTPNKSRGRSAALTIGVIAVVLGCALVVGVAIAAYFYYEQSKPEEQANEPTSRPFSDPSRQPERVSILAKTFPVAARKYVYYTIPLKSGVTHVRGHFTAEGGSNDIEVLVLDQEGFTNFSNGHNAKAYYNSDGYVTTGTIDLNLGSGTYFVVFNNTKAMMTNKVVTAKIDAEFDPR